MYPNSSLRVLSRGAALALAALAVSTAHAQPTMTPPACQCSTPTPVPGLSMTVVHCLCGGVTCVLSDVTGGGKASAPLMQCVK